MLDATRSPDMIAGAVADRIRELLPNAELIQAPFVESMGDDLEQAAKTVTLMTGEDSSERAHK